MERRDVGNEEMCVDETKRDAVLVDAHTANLVPFTIKKAKESWFACNDT